MLDIEYVFVIIAKKNSNSWMSKRKYFQRLIKKSNNQWHFFAQHSFQYVVKKKTQNKYIFNMYVFNIQTPSQIGWWNAKDIWQTILFLNINLPELETGLALLWIRLSSSLTIISSSGSMIVLPAPPCNIWLYLQPKL